MNIQLKTLLTYTVFIALHSTRVNAQTSGSGLTAEQIVQIGIDSSGGEIQLSANNTVEYIKQVITAATDTLSIAVKKRGFKNSYISILSLTHINSTRNL